MSRAMREKYCVGHCSDLFIETGIPQITREQLAAAAKQEALLRRQVAKDQRKAEKAARKIYEKNPKADRRNPANKIVFC